MKVEEKADHCFRYLALQPNGQSLVNLTVGRDPAVLRYCLRKRLVKILPTGTKQWQDGEDAAALPLDTWLDELDKPESRSIVAVGEAGRAILNDEFQEHRGQPEKLAAKERRAVAFREGR